MNGIADLNLNGDGHFELETLPPIQLAFTLPSSPDTRVHLQVTNAAKSLLLFVSNSTVGAPSTGVALGNLVFAMPNMSSVRSNEMLSTALYTKTGSIDFITRLAKVLATRARKPVYTGGEVRFWSVEDEGEALRGIVEVVMGRLAQDEQNGTT